MAKRLFVPRTNAEAERLLWHALEYIKTDLTSDHVECGETIDILEEAIADCQGRQ